MAIPVIVMLNSLTNIVLFAGCRKSVDLKRISPLIIAGIATVPVGMALLLILNVSLIKLIVGCVIFLFALTLLLGYRRVIDNERRGFLAAGVISGTLNGLTSTGGPPVILFLSNQGVGKVAFRANLITYFLFLNIATLPIFLAGGLLSLSIVRYAAVFAPVVALGTLAGSRLIRHVPEKIFRILTLIIVMLAGVVAILSSLGLI
jgi:uncharacterized membrane protein YfcA